ncbi:putative 5' nucleotidase family protein [Blattamonas nauphoetae]|uniref:5' nucleotidase family protein n=1 Tax=Blattamonas nauphoetae TaxID=2049346 RepID=A0ABQ9WYZ5_9EUKA|nr:putative 5' nucleotidase family protein [Blattamonas nauphoetae]
MLLSTILVLFCSDTCQSATPTLTILHTSDIHGWIYGHRHEPARNADAGDLYNFIYHRKMRRSPNEIVLAFDSGDMIEGTGLGEVNDSRGAEIFNIMKDIPYDGLMFGNHDIKYDKSVDHLFNSFAPVFGERYLGGQGVYYNSSKTLGNPFNVLSLGTEGNILVIGFTYNIANVQTHIKVTGVSAYLKLPWFAQAMAVPNVRAIICVCHIGSDHTHLDNIHGKIRSHHPSTPVVFLTGHTHTERTMDLDEEGFIMEPGRYFNKIGVMSFTLPPKTTKRTKTNFAKLEEVNGGLVSGIDKSTFNHKYLETNVTKMQNEIGMNSTAWMTTMGARIRANLQSRLRTFGLLNQIGCSPQTYSNSAYASEEKSIYRLLVDVVYPASGGKRSDVFRHNGIINNGQNEQNAIKTLYIQDVKMRYSMYEGPVLLDDLYCTDPMGYEQHGILNIRGSHLKALWESEGSKSSTPKKGPSLAYLGVEDDEEALDGNFNDDRWLTTCDIVDSEVYDLFMPNNVAAQAKKILDIIAPGVYSVQTTGMTSRQIFQKFIQTHWKC